MTPSSSGNDRLSALLRQLRWNPESLARRINAQRVGQRPISVKTPYKWISRGEVPHGDLPDLVHRLLSAALDVDLSYEDVWGSARRRPATVLPADHVMDLPWDSSGLLTLLGVPVPTRRTIIALAGTALTNPAWAALAHPAPVLVSVADEGRPVTPPLLAMIDTIVAQAQCLDDQQGGAARDFVRDQFTAVARLLRRASYDAETGRRLAAALAQLAQTAGFMAFDACDDGAAQLWYFTGLRAAHAAADPALAASILALMSNQAADRGHAIDALQLASAAREAASGTPAAVRALVSARSGLAHAAAGDLTGFCRSRQHTFELLDVDAPCGDPLPRWASYIDSVELDAIHGRGLVVLADRLPVRRIGLMRQAIPLLQARADTDLAAPPQRSALRHGAWLSLAHTAVKDLDLAVSTARMALARLPAVTSARSVALLQRLQDDLGPAAARSHPVRLLVHDLRRLST